MIYCFKCPRCKATFEKALRIAESSNPQQCPDCGLDAVDRDYQAERKGDRNDLVQSNQYPYVSHRLPRNLEGCQCDAKGKPVIMSPKHEREVASRLRMRRD